MDKNEIFEMNKGNIYQVSPSSSLPRQQMCVYVCGVRVSLCVLRTAFLPMIYGQTRKKSLLELEYFVYTIQYTYK